MDKKLSFEEFKLMYESTEKVTDRRIALNQFNYSICTAVFLAIAFLWNWSLTNTKYSYVGIFITFILSIIASIFTFYWIRQIKDYKLLNTAKFKVINEMSGLIYFNSGSDKIKISSFEPFAKEWEFLNDLSALQKRKIFNIKALKSSNYEYFIPNAFGFLFLSLSLISLLTIFFNRSAFLTALKGALVLQ